MKSLLFVIKDAKSGVHGVPYSFVSRGVALREFNDLVNNPKAAYAKHPDDYSLWYIGEYDDLTGRIVSIEPEHMANATDFVFKTGGINGQE